MDISWEKNSSIHTHIVFKKAERVVAANVGKSIREAGLTTAQFAVLDVLYTKGEMRICQLMQKMLATSGNMTVVIKNMQRDELLYRNRDVEDKRAFVVGLTEKGRKLFEKILPEHRKEIEEAYSDFTDNEKEVLISILKKFKNKEIKLEDKKCQNQ